jgi:outer membrane protein TolC
MNVTLRSVSLRCIRTAIAAGLLLASGCSSNPFTLNELDRAPTTPAERLRTIKNAGLDRFVQPPSPTPEPTDALRTRFANVEKFDLAIETARASVLENNLDLKVALVDPAIAQERVSEEAARFESAFTLRTAWQETDSPTSSSLTSATGQNRLVEPGVRLPLITGGTATVTLPVSRNENDNSFSTLNPAYTSDLQFSISHPLLRNAGRRTNTTSLRIAGYSQQASEARTKLEAIRQVAAADRSYWRLYQAARDLEVRQQQYELADAQLKRAQRRVSQELSAEIEVIRAQSGLSDRLEAIITAQRTLLLQQRELKRIINIPGLTIDTTTQITITTDPDPVEFIFDTSQLCTEAIDNRMELLEIELQLASDAATIALQRNQTLPLLSLDYTYRVNGLGDSVGDSFHTLGRNRFEDWELGLNAEIPLGNEAARARLASSILTRIQRLNTRAAREQSIRQEVLNAVDVINEGWQRILAARQSVILNTRALQAEQRSFDVGRSTSTDVLDAASRLAESQLTEIRALAEYQIAQVDLAFATGTLLGAAKVDWAPVGRPSLEGPDPEERLERVERVELDKGVGEGPGKVPAGEPGSATEATHPPPQ